MYVPAPPHPWPLRPPRQLSLRPFPAAGVPACYSITPNYIPSLTSLMPILKPLSRCYHLAPLHLSSDLNPTRILARRSQTPQVKLYTTSTGVVEGYT
jgi:hypothetical protein